METRPPEYDIEAPSAGDEEEVNPVEDIARTLRRIHSRYLWALLLLYCLSAGIGIGTVLLYPVRDWLMFVGMYLVLLAYMTTYIKAHQRKRPWLKLLSLVFVEGLLGFWIFVLIDRIPGRRVFVDGQIATRDEMPFLWGSVGLLAVVGAMLLLHWAWVGRLHNRAHHLAGG